MNKRERERAMEHERRARWVRRARLAGHDGPFERLLRGEITPRQYAEAVGLPPKRNTGGEG